MKSLWILRYSGLAVLAFMTLALMTIQGCNHGNPSAATAEGTSLPRTHKTRGAQPAHPRTGVVTFTAAGTTLRVNVEIVSSPKDRARGLMYRKKLPEMSGMLFIFPTQDVQTFWMHNTYISLDMIFIEDKTMKVVGVVENAEPMTDTTRDVGRPSRYVVEVNAGFAKRHGITVGATMSFTEESKP